ncbi:GNAT family N-acetyltransferase [Ponticoccus litoralis]|uniref:GNAT family N-acetyltransferase n=1 Tax=Ponticoccus litoralis TaxID=422297 RepID=UPI003D2EB48A
MMPALSISTERLTLRTPVLADFDAVEAYARSPRAFFTGGQQTEQMPIWRGFLGTAGHWALKGYGMFTVLRDGTPVGRVGVIDHVMWEEPELGWHLFEGHEGRGLRHRGRPRRPPLGRHGTRPRAAGLLCPPGQRALAPRGRAPRRDARARHHPSGRPCAGLAPSGGGRDMIAPCEIHRPGPAARTAARLGGRLPVLDTRRLQLRGPRIYDFDSYAEILCSDRAGYMGGPMTRAEALGRIHQLHRLLAAARPRPLDHRRADRALCRFRGAGL